MDLVIMAGGLGSRFGGLKQVESIDKNGNFIIDYTIYDAIRCGFDKVVIVINKDNLNIFDETIGKRVKKHIKLEYVFQENPFSDLRKKPLGTAHAVLCAKNSVNDKFVVLNADDFYGYKSLLTAKNTLENLQENEYSMVCFDAGNTLSNFGAVKRGVCEVSDDGYLKNVSEKQIFIQNGMIKAKDVGQDDEGEVIKAETLISMNLWGFNKSFFDFLERGFDDFCSNEDNIKNKEYFLPGVVEKVIKNYNYKVRVFKTPSKWFGLTYKEDKDEFVKNLNSLIDKGEYPSSLW